MDWIDLLAVQGILKSLLYARLGFPGALPQRRVVWMWFGAFPGPWTARRSNQSVLKEINPEYSLKGLMLKL